ncbi:hypothetical protein [Paenibacillus sp. URB8-2]|uniref:hypothetical protein n=1 Tax=Paenibacillus sp. URB8-2 TaxID=2741301 RepID=UPI0015C2BF6F|nr:hypothetical protein [Paenibacillus sp. URB8-2]BCG61014.1 hypothetical protein PUR_44390 [Paenibacillus sp. URB8-2]
MRNSSDSRWAEKLQLRDIGAAMAAGLAAVACVKRGLFFPEDGYPIWTIWFLLCGAAAASLLQGGGERRQAWNGNWAHTIMLGGLVVMIILYAADWIRGPLSAQGTMNELLRWSGFASFAILVWTAASGYSAGRLLWAAWHAVGMLLCLSGLLSFCGALPIPYAVLNSASPEVSAAGARLGGLLQYPNAFGAAMAVFLLERLFAAAQSCADHSGKRLERNSEGGGVALSYRRDAGLSLKGKDGGGILSGWTGSGRNGSGWKGREPVAKQAEPFGFGHRRTAKGPLRGELLRLAPLFPYAAALLLSESRGAWLAAACAAAAALPLQRRLALPLLAAGAAP